MSQIIKLNNMKTNIIYSIYKYTNLINNKIYIGYTKNIQRRIGKHKHACKKSNYIFYRAVRKHGWDNFELKIIYQSKSKSHIKKMEKYFIEEYRSYIGFKDCNGYNMTLGGESQSYFQIKFYEFIDPNDNYISGYNLSEFCQLNNLRYDTMINLLLGKRKSHKGYRNVNYPNFIQPGFRTYILYDENNNKIEFSNMSEFARQHNLCEQTLNKVITGKKKSYKGFKSDPNYIPINKRLYTLIDPNGNVVTFNSIRIFCNENNLLETNISTLLHGKIKSSKGYRNYK